MKCLKDIYHAINESYFRLTGMKPWTSGYAEYRIRQIKKALMINPFHADGLPLDYGFRLDERIVEYPWFFSRLPGNASGKLLDAGSVLNFDIVLQHESLKVKNVFISTLAPEPVCYWHDGISYVYEDLRDSCFKDEYFDWIASLSTIEHIGLDNTMLYTDDVSKDENYSTSYLAAVMEYHRMLKPGGVLYLSFPFGKAENRGWFQIFDGAMVDELISVFRPSKQNLFYYKYEPQGWRASTREEAKDATYFDIHTRSTYDADYAAASRSIICLELVK